MDNQNIIIYIPVVVSVKVNVFNAPFRVPSILKRKRIRPTDAECAAFLNDIIWDDLGFSRSDFLD